MTERPKAVLEQIFANKTARVLDHLITMKPFDYTFAELQDILQIEANSLHRILTHLQKYGLIEVNTQKNTQKIKIADNKKTQALNKCLFDIACENMEEIVRNEKDNHNHPSTEARKS